MSNKIFEGGEFFRVGDAPLVTDLCRK